MWLEIKAGIMIIAITVNKHRYWKAVTRTGACFLLSPASERPLSRHARCWLGQPQFPPTLAVTLPGLLHQSEQERLIRSVTY